MSRERIASSTAVSKGWAKPEQMLRTSTHPNGPVRTAMRAMRERNNAAAARRDRIAQAAAPIIVEAESGPLPFDILPEPRGIDDVMPPITPAEEQ